jgi:hypothetical protein
MANLITSDSLVLLKTLGRDDDSGSSLVEALQSQIDPSVYYSCTMLFHHIAEGGQVAKDMLVELAFFFENLFLSWAEVACTASSSNQTLISQLGIVRDLVSVCGWRLTSFNPHMF